MSHSTRRLAVSRRPSSAALRRSGFSLLETVVAIALAAALLTLLAEMTLLLKRQTSIRQTRDQILLQLENVVEEASLLPWVELNSEQVQQLHSWQQIRQRWPDAAVDIITLPEKDPAAAKQIAMEVRLAPQRDRRPVRLSGWVVARSAEK